ncbi:MAG TPA: hypothetical protein VJP76_09285 [Candidatus Tumulicola sp.]|nr:hypothetical protein [Candidatus Tumulicola sp.]
MSDVRSTFFSVARCPNVRACFDSGAPNPCREIVQVQEAPSYDAFQLPEPWVGQIDVARILFVASNPSIGDDDHAHGSSDDETIFESHHLAFGGGSRPYILDGTKTTKPDGSPGHTVHYWSAIKGRAEELIPNARPGTDYCITEVVHCESKDEVGVAKAAGECYSRHFESVVAVSIAPVIVALGAFAWKRFLDGTHEPPARPIQRTFGGRPRTIVFLPHPSSFGGPKKIAERYSPEDLGSLERLLALARG